MPDTWNIKDKIFRCEEGFCIHAEHLDTLRKKILSDIDEVLFKNTFNDVKEKIDHRFGVGI